MAIHVVDYELMPKQANEMRGYAKELNGEMTKAYATVGEMHQAWYGKRYNELVVAFNNMIPSLNEMLKLIVTDIPSALERIANNYAQVDKGQNVTAVSTEEPNRLVELAITEDVGLHYLNAEVAAAKSRILANFDNAKDKMNQIESVYAKLVWQSSDASEAFKSTFTRLKGEIVSSFENINVQFTKLMDQTQQDIEQAEKANTVN